MRSAPYNSSRPSRAGPLVVVLAGALAAGCGAMSSGVTPTEPVTPPEAFSSTGEAERAERWWTAFDDPGLTAAIDSALESNLDLLAAWQRIEAARAVVERESGERVPSVDATAAAGLEVATRGGDPWIVRLGLEATYEVDLWGRVEARIEGEELRADATLSDYQAAAISLAAEVAVTWTQLAEAQEQLALIERQLETNHTTLRSLEQRFGQGLTSAADVLRQRSLVEAAQEEREALRARHATLRHRLAILLGHAPQRAVETPQLLPEVPPLPDTGVPVTLIERRPDVRSALLRVEAADRDVAAAIAEQYPRLTLSASIGSGGPSAERLFRDWVASVAGGLLAPIFRGGELRAEVDRVEAVRQERIFAYGQAVLTALRDVEDALVREARQRDRLARLEERIALAVEAYEVLRLEYLNGARDYLDVLNALDELQTLRRSLVDARGGLVEQRIALYRALAGPIGEEAPPDSDATDPE